MTQDSITLLALAQARLQAEPRPGRRAANTVRCYINDSRPALAWLAEHQTPIAQAQPADLQHYLDGLHGRYRPATIRRISVSLRRVCQALVDTGILPHNPALHLRVPSRRQAARRPPPLPVPTVKCLLAAPPNSVKGVRDRAMLAGMACHGLTVGEVCGLDVADVDLQKNALRVVGRGGRVRMVALTAPTAAVFRRWLAARALLKPDTDALFTSLHWTAGRAAPGQRISVRGARQMVAGYLAQVGVSQPGVSCQALRATYAALALAAGADLRAVAASLGHASTATTQAYAADAEVIQENPARYLAGLL